MDLILYACVIGTSGLKGALKVFVYSEAANLTQYEFLFLKDGAKLFLDHKKSLIKQGKRATVKFFDIDSYNDAEKLCKQELFIKRDMLPEPGSSEYYYFDLIGAEVLTPSMGSIGKVFCVHNFGAGDILEVEVHHDLYKGKCMIPFRNEHIEKDELPERLWIYDETFNQYCLAFLKG